MIAEALREPVHRHHPTPCKIALSHAPELAADIVDSRPIVLNGRARNCFANLDNGDPKSRPTIALMIARRSA